VVSIDRKKFIVLAAILSINTFVLSFASTFNIIFIIKSGYSYAHAAVFILIQYSAALLFIVIFAKKIFSNFRKSIIIAFAFILAFYTLFSLMSGLYLLLLGPMLMGIFMAFFWMPVNTLQAELMDGSNNGKIAGIFTLVSAAIGISASFIGGVVIDILNFNSVYAISAIFIAVNAAIVLLFLKDISKRDIARSIKIGKLSDLGLVFQGFYEVLLEISIPIFVLSFAHTATDMGEMFSLFALFGAVATLVIGVISDRFSKLRIHVIMFSSFVIGASIIVLSLSNSIYTFIGSMSIVNFIMPIIGTGMYVLIIERMTRKKSEAMFVREVFLNSGRISAIIIAIVLLLLGFSVANLLIVSSAAAILIFITGKWGDRRIEGLND